MTPASAASSRPGRSSDGPRTLQDRQLPERLQRLLASVRVPVPGREHPVRLTSDLLAAEMTRRGYRIAGSSIRKVRNAEHDPSCRVLLGICVTVTDLTGVTVTPDYFFVAEQFARTQAQLDERRKQIDQDLRDADLALPTQH